MNTSLHWVPRFLLFGAEVHGISARSCFFSFDTRHLSLPAWYSMVCAPHSSRSPSLWRSFIALVNTSRSISLPTCPFWLDAGLYGNIFVVILVEFILGLRVWALWGRSKRVAICLMATFFGLTAFGLYKVITIRETQTTFSIEYFRISGQCPPRFSGVDGLSGSNALTSGFIILVLYELVVLILTLLKASNQGWLGPHGSESRFINGFLSQGVAYNCLILVGSTINIIARYKLPSAYVNLFTDLQPVIHTVLTSRMMFYLRKNAFDHETPASDILTGIVGFNPSLPLVRPPTESCPQMSVLDLGSPLGVWEHTNWKQEDSV
ncbi:hypothetical protein E1B28_009074 [Marasmius oreades]|uniref:Uncharacterized protein n=1 Tax=Marasmius oreades TaxID=181124 RepID=A0A9P7USF2_9AGAR|nr:uncharacterized protein E1B28_009074 [Marasmius oreades]KAG7092747.1 hypothetical protein E1B28_009074 [Marasmius oreades]